VFLASVLIDYFKAHIRRVFVELHGTGSSDVLATALREFLEEHGGSWEGTATELKEALADREVEGCHGGQKSSASKYVLWAAAQRL
jgi:hypothetical protein